MTADNRGYVCAARLIGCLGEPTRAYVIFGAGGRPLLCQPCVASMREMGMQVEREQRHEPRPGPGRLARLRARAAG